MDQLNSNPISIEHQQLIPEYTLVEVLGKGTSGVVYRAKDNSDEKEYAIKIIECYPGVEEKYLSEVKIQSKLDHPLICKCFRFIEKGKYLLIVLEHFDGIPLRDVVIENETKKESQFDKPSIIKNLIEGMSYIHQQGVLHNDIHEGNVLVNNQNEIKIIDFGTASYIVPNYNISLQKEEDLDYMGNCFCILKHGYHYCSKHEEEMCKASREKIEELYNKRQQNNLSIPMTLEKFQDSAASQPDKSIEPPASSP